MPSCVAARAEEDQKTAWGAVFPTNAQSLYCSWSREFLEAGKKRLAGDTARAATSAEVKDPRREALDLKEVVAEQALELRLLKKHDRALSAACCACAFRVMDGGDDE